MRLLFLSSLMFLDLGSGSYGDNQLKETTYDRQKRSARPATCLDRFAVIPGHTMCIADLKDNPPIPTDRQTIVAKHNIARSNVNPPAADMLEMEYFTSLEREAQIWADHCKMEHDNSYQRYQPGRFQVGQNIAISPKLMNWTEVIDLWNSESSKFVYGSSNNLLDVGHYTQLVWAKTMLVGCGMAKCGDKYMYVCNYAPSGNQGSLDKPYERSVSGQSCDSCNGHCNSTAKLCHCAGKFCLNGGTLDLTTCQCQCNKNVNYYDPNVCELVCEDKSDNPLCGPPPFDKASCATNTATVINCPALCNICPYAGANYTERSVPLPKHNSAAILSPSVVVLLLTAILSTNSRHLEELN